MNKVKYILPVLLVVLGSCTKPQVLPDEPRIWFKSFILDEKPDVLGNNVLTGELTFEFQDGDGDIGFHPPADTTDLPDSLMYNVFLTIHEKAGGRFVRIDTSELEVPPYYRIPPLDREGQNKTLRGEIMIDIQYLVIRYDTIRYSFYIMDRAFHRSNVDTTDIIVFTGWKE